MLTCIAERTDGTYEVIRVPEPKQRELFLQGIKDSLRLGGDRLSRKLFENKGYACVTTLHGTLLYPLFKKRKDQKGRRRPKKFDRNFLRRRPAPARLRFAA